MDHTMHLNGEETHKTTYPMALRHPTKELGHCHRQHAQNIW